METLWFWLLATQVSCSCIQRVIEECIVSNKRCSFHFSARDVYEELHKSGVELEPKGFAVGFRIEHPQRLINEIQYGSDWGGRVVSQFICLWQSLLIRPVRLILSDVTIILAHYATVH